MNYNQRWVIGVGAGLALLAVLCVPWVRTGGNPIRDLDQAGYHFVFTPPVNIGPVRANYTQVAFEIAGILAATAAAFFLVPTPKPTPPPPGTGPIDFPPADFLARIPTALPPTSSPAKTGTGPAPPGS